MKRDGKASRWRDLRNTAVEKGLCGGELLKKERGNDRHTPWYRSRGTLGWAGGGGGKLSWAMIVADQIR